MFDFEMTLTHTDVGCEGVVSRFWKDDLCDHKYDVAPATSAALTSTPFRKLAESIWHIFRRLPWALVSAGGGSVSCGGRHLGIA